MLFRLNPSARAIKFIAHKNIINEVSINPLGNLIASCSDDSTIKLWKNNIHGFSHLIKIHQSSVKSIDFSPSGKLLISGGKDKKIKIYFILKIFDLFYWIENAWFNCVGISWIGMV